MEQTHIKSRKQLRKLGMGAIDQWGAAGRRHSHGEDGDGARHRGAYVFAREVRVLPRVVGSRSTWDLFLNVLL